eukprot:EG_transcript_34829
MVIPAILSYAAPIDHTHTLGGVSRSPKIPMTISFIRGISHSAPSCSSLTKPTCLRQQSSITQLHSSGWRDRSRMYGAVLLFATFFKLPESSDPVTVHFGRCHSLALQSAQLPAHFGPLPNSQQQAPPTWHLPRGQRPAAQAWPPPRPDDPPPPRAELQPRPRRAPI